MKPWKETSPDRLHPQEQALLALCDRMVVLERVFREEVEAHRLTRKRLDHVQKVQDLHLGQIRREISRIKGETRSILDILRREE